MYVVSIIYTTYNFYLKKLFTFEIGESNKLMINVVGTS